MCYSRCYIIFRNNPQSVGVRHLREGDSGWSVFVHCVTPWLALNEWTNGWMYCLSVRHGISFWRYTAEWHGRELKREFRQCSTRCKNIRLIMESPGHVLQEEILSRLMKRVRWLSQMQVWRDSTSHQRYRGNKWYDVSWDRQILGTLGSVVGVQGSVKWTKLLHGGPCRASDHPVPSCGTDAD